MFNAVTITLPVSVTAPGLDLLVAECRRQGVDLVADPERIVLSAQVGRVLSATGEHVFGVALELADMAGTTAAMQEAIAIVADGTEPCGCECGYCDQVRDEIAREQRRSTERAERFA